MTNRFQRLELEETQGTSTSHAKAIPAQEVLPQEALHDQVYWTQQADKSRRSGDYEAALRNYSRAVEADRSTVAAWVGQVRMLIALGEYPEAELWARKALEWFKGHADLNAARAQALCRRGDFRGAQASCDAALSQPGLTAYPWIARGEILLARREAAEEYCFDKATQLDPDWLTLIEIASIYLHYRRPAKALARARKAAEHAPEQPFPWFETGRCELAMGMKPSARRSFKRCLDLDSKHERARAELVRFSPGTGSLRGAIRRLFGRND